MSYYEFVIYVESSRSSPGSVEGVSVKKGDGPVKPSGSASGNGNPLFNKIEGCDTATDRRMCTPQGGRLSVGNNLLSASTWHNQQQSLNNYPSQPAALSMKDQRQSYSSGLNNWANQVVTAAS